MDRGVEQPLPPTLGGLAIAWVFFDVGNQPRIEDHLPVACGIKAAIKVEIQTPPTPALRLCIIKPIGFAGLFRECNPCFSGHYRLFALKKANLLNDALVARMSWRGLSRAVPPRRGATCTRPRPPARAAAESSGPDGSSLSAQTQHLNHEPPTACNTLLSKEL